MSDEIVWLRERAYETQGRLGAHEAKIEVLAKVDGQNREDIHKVSADLAALRQEVRKEFADMGARLDLHLGALRAELAGIKAVPSERSGLPVRWIVIGALVMVGVVAAVAYGIGFASNASHFRAVADGLASQ